MYAFFSEEYKSYIDPQYLENQIQERFPLEKLQDYIDVGTPAFDGLCVRMQDFYKDLMKRFLNLAETTLFFGAGNSLPQNIFVGLGVRILHSIMSIYLDSCLPSLFLKPNPNHFVIPSGFRRPGCILLF